MAHSWGGPEHIPPPAHVLEGKAEARGQGKLQSACQSLPDSELGHSWEA